MCACVCTYVCLCVHVCMCLCVYICVSVRLHSLTVSCTRFLKVALLVASRKYFAASSSDGSSSSGSGGGSAYLSSFHRTREIPFSSVTKWMAVFAHRRNTAACFVKVRACVRACVCVMACL